MNRVCLTVIPPFSNFKASSQHFTGPQSNSVVLLLLPRQRKKENAYSKGRNGAESQNEQVPRIPSH